MLNLSVKGNEFDKKELFYGRQRPINFIAIEVLSGMPHGDWKWLCDYKLTFGSQKSFSSRGNGYR
jgi:hypothetical protein